jgi:hypothetical protein
MHQDKQHQKKIGLLFFLTITGVLSVFLFQPLSQDPAYHLLADTRSILSIPNFWNVLSNIPFLLIGLIGMIYIRRGKLKGILQQLSTGYLVFFSGIFFTGLGSAYYHLSPSNDTLLWDRIPMTISFMAFSQLSSESLSVFVQAKFFYFRF